MIERILSTNHRPTCVRVASRLEGDKGRPLPVCLCGHGSKADSYGLSLPLSHTWKRSYIEIVKGG